MRLGKIDWTPENNNKKSVFSSRRGRTCYGDNNNTVQWEKLP
jgi:hypothetical protein